MRVASVLCTAALLGVAAPLAAQQSLDSALLAAYRWRNIGPDRGGRSIAVSGVKGRPREAYFGAAGGGLWKTTDGGTTWSPVTDGQIRTASVGDVAVSESNPDVVFIGMGEACIRGNIIPGDGVYRSTDGGKSWTHVGFAESHAIAKIRIHPTDPQIVFVASFGKYSVPSAERGVFKSTDGGRTWRRVLYRDDKTGAVDIAIDRTNPNVIYAALWEAYRTEYQMSSGGAGSGLFKSMDGGETWTEITRNPGLPRGVVGRIGVAVSGANPKRVYALVENENGGLYRSEDAGATWALVNDRRSIRQRAFYYTHVFADPKNADVVYMQNTTMFRSADGGKTMKSVNNGTHGDFHDLWIDPDDAAHLVVGNDGGGAVSTDTAQSWTEEDYPTEQFYHVSTTTHIPYHVCGAQQDNSTLCTPFNWNAVAFAAPPDTSAAARPRDITLDGMRVSYPAGGGEPGYVAPDPLNPDVFYSGTNNGNYVDRYDRRLGTSREVNPYPWFYSGEPAKDIRERWQWTFPIIFSKADPRTLYVSSQRLWRSRDGGKTWSALSGDLTRHEPKTLERSGGPITGDMNGPEVYGTIFSVGPGKRDVNVIWTGSDDGLVYVTRDGGATWTNVTPRAMPDLGRVSQIDASAFDDGTAYVSVRRPLLNDFAPYIFKTADFGRTWTKIVAGIRPDAYVHAVREDPTRRGLLYAATQHGVYVSFDDGATWQPLNPGLPDVPVADLVVEGNELVVATHGRGFWVLDNIAPLRQATPEHLGADAWLFTPPRAVRSGPGVTVSWWLKTKPPARTARLEILDSTGAVLRSWEPDTTPPERRDTAGRGAGGEAEGPGPRRREPAAVEPAYATVRHLPRHDHVGRAKQRAGRPARSLHRAAHCRRPDPHGADRRRAESLDRGRHGRGLAGPVRFLSAGAGPGQRRERGGHRDPARPESAGGPAQAVDRRAAPRRRRHAPGERPNAGGAHLPGAEPEQSGSAELPHQGQQPARQPDVHGGARRRTAHEQHARAVSDSLRRAAGLFGSLEAGVVTGPRRGQRRIGAAGVTEGRPDGARVSAQR